MTHAPAARKRPGGSEDDDGDSEADSVVPPPDGGWGWVVVWASFMIHIVSEYGMEPSAFPRGVARIVRERCLQTEIPQVRERQLRGSDPPPSCLSHTAESMLLPC